MISCNGITLNYAVILYNKKKFKIKIVQISPRNCRKLLWFPIFSMTAGIRLRMCWKASWKRDFIRLRHKKPTVPLSNWYPSEEQWTCIHIRKSDPNINFVTVAKRKFCVYRYEKISIKFQILLFYWAILRNVWKSEGTGDIYFHQCVPVYPRNTRFVCQTLVHQIIFPAG